MTDVRASLRGLLASGKYSDLTISCQNLKFSVHCAIVCTQSPVLAAAIDGNFEEATSHHIDLSEDEPCVVTALVKYFYDGDYDVVKSIPSTPDLRTNVPERPATPDGSLSLLFHVKIYIIADRLNMPTLKDLIKNKFEEVVESHWNSKTFTEAAALLCENTFYSDTPLRDVVAGVASLHVVELLGEGEFADLMARHGEFCLDVLKMNLGIKAVPLGARVPRKRCKSDRKDEVGNIWG